MRIRLLKFEGEKVARDYEEFYENEIGLEAQGIGILSDSIIRMSGLFGSNLPSITEDGRLLSPQPAM